MINANNGEMWCDECSYCDLYDNDGDFYVLIELAKQDGWRSVKNSDQDWVNLCPDCYREFAGK